MYKSTTHFKIQFDDQLRRFALQNPTFEELISTIETLLCISEPLALKYRDDEGDWVTVSTNVELQHAIELSEVPLRLNVEVLSSTNGRGCGEKGRGRGRGRGCKNFTPAERMNIKSDRLTKRIENLEYKLENGEIPNGRARVLVWRLEKMKKKLEFVEQQKQAFKDGVPPSDTPPFFGGRGGRGRGGCGRGRGGRGRGRRGLEWRDFEVSDPSSNSSSDATTTSDTTTSGDVTTSTEEILPKNLNIQIRTCRQKLNAAKKSGNEEEIKICEQALNQVLEAKKAKQEKNKLINEALKEKRAHLQQCKSDVRNARQNGASNDVIQSKVTAVQEAKKQLQEARAQFGTQ